MVDDLDAGRARSVTQHDDGVHGVLPAAGRRQETPTRVDYGASTTPEAQMA